MTLAKKLSEKSDELNLYSVVSEVIVTANYVVLYFCRCVAN